MFQASICEAGDRSAGSSALGRNRTFLHRISYSFTCFAARRPATSDTDPTSNRKIPGKWVSISPTTSTRRTCSVPGKRCSENDALGTATAHLAQLGKPYTYTAHSNGHRKAPKSENAYKLLLHKVDWLLERLRMGHWRLLTPPSFTASLRVAPTLPSTRSCSVA